MSTQALALQADCPSGPVVQQWQVTVYPGQRRGTILHLNRMRGPETPHYLPLLITHRAAEPLGFEKQAARALCARQRARRRAEGRP